MTFGVKSRLIFFAVLSICGMLFVGATGYLGQTRQAEALADMNTKLRALRNHLESDMMHDALRGDVLAALHAGATGKNSEQDVIKAELADHIATFEANLKDTAGLALPTEISAALAQVAPALAAYERAASEIVDLSFRDNAAAEAQLGAFSTAFGALEDEMESLSNLIEDHANKSQTRAKALAADGLKLLIAIISVVGVLCIGFSVWTIRTVITPLRQLQAAILRLRQNDGVLERLNGFKSEFADVQAAFNAVLDDLEEKRRVEQERADGAYRVQLALGVATANIVLTDREQNIIYVNDTAQALFRQHGGALARDLPQLRSDALVGSPVATLYREGPAVLGMLNQLSGSRRDEYTLGGRRFSINATPVQSATGARLGTVFEWADLTEEHNAAEQIQSALSAAVAGQLDRRLDVSRMQGFMRTMGEGVNQMLDAIVGPLRVAAEHLSQIAEGKVPGPIGAEFNGEFEVMRKNLNTCSEVLRALIDDVARLVAAASEGRLGERADLERHWGDYRRIVQGVNQTLDAIVGPVTETTEVMTGIAEGNLTKRMDGSYSGDFARLRDAVNSSTSNLLDMVEKIRDAAGSIGTASGEISKGNQDLNRRTTEQATALEETSSSLRSITETVKQNTQNARQANQLAANARDEAEKGGNVVSSAVSAMVEINASSRKIADIISVIDGIAFQTNLLALNAAVEAARAGEQGRGFAVVAAEVRNLAQRSAGAAKEIKTLISDSVNRVDEGTRLVNESGETLQAIVGSVKKVSDIIAEIAAASEEQLGGIEGLNRAVESMDETTQQNAALVEQAAAASESMDTQAQSLTTLMAFFRVNQGAPQGSVAPVTSERRTAARPWSKPKSAASKPASAVGGENWEDF